MPFRLFRGRRTKAERLGDPKHRRPTPKATRMFYVDVSSNLFILVETTQYNGQWWS